MGKGKKKGDKKEKKQDEELAVGVSSLTLGEASPAQETTSASVPATSVASAAPATSAPPVTPAAPATPAAVKVEDDDDGGLCLGGARKKRPKKKKEAPQTVAPQAPGPSSAPQAHAPQPTLPEPHSAPASSGQDRPAWQAQPPAPSAPLTWRQPAGPPPGLTQPAGPPPGLTQPTSQSPWSGPQPGTASQRPTPPRVQPSGPPQAGPQRSESSQSMAGRGGAQGDRAVVSVGSSDGVCCRYRIPARVHGTGRIVRSNQIKVLVNYLPMQIKALKVHRYDVAFKPDKPKKMIPRAFAKAKELLFRDAIIAFDQMKNCYALNPLPKVTQTDRVSTVVDLQDNNGRTISFEVSFKGTGIVDLGTINAYMNKGGTSLSPPTEAIQCIDVILRQGTLESYIKAGRQFFQRPAQPINLGQGLEMWTGLFQSAIFTSRPFINIDVAHKGFPRQQSLIDALIKDFRLDPNSPIEKQRSREIDSFKFFVKGLRVMATIGGDSSARGSRREFICNELVDGANTLRFNMTNAAGQTSMMTVADYFAKEKRIRLRYPNLNCVWVGPRDKNIYYPMEFLEVSYGQARNRQLNDMQLSTMVKEAATPPNERKRKIEEVIRNMKYAENSYFKKFGLEIKNEFSTVNAKVLAPPSLEVGGGQKVEPRRGVWQANKLLKAETLDAWAIVALDLDYNACNAEYIIQQIVNVGRRIGMSVSEPPHENQYYNVRMHDLPNVMRNAAARKLKFLIVIVATRGRDYYQQVKKLAEREVGILTQCIKENTAVRRMNDQTMKNILLKVNSKLMGVNQALDTRSMPRCLADGPCMVVGADVTHPSPDQSSVPSIAAVTASIDAQCFRYNIELSVQTPKKEMIVEFKDMMVDHLKVYKQNMKTLPKKIFVFRDGVSEGQFAQVMNSELTAVVDAYKQLAGPNARPEVLFILVQKRHHTRFFVPNSASNVEPGTVVDSDIVHASELDFYMVSHHAIKGTARPTRYHAVCNDGNIPHDEVEQLTYYLCHLYSRCTRAVSYPTPTYYAHLACLRARTLTFGEKFNNVDLEKQPQRLRVMQKILETSRMFFV